MQDRFNAIVVGAGPAGSSAAILLARAGWSVALVEKHIFPRRKVCGECIAAGNLPLLHALGIGSAFKAIAGAPLRQLALLRGYNRVVADLPSAAHEKYPWGQALGRDALDTLLIEQARLDGAQLFQPWAVQEIDGAAGNWRCDIRAAGSGERRILRAPVVIDAHGSWEALASARAQGRPVHKPSDLFAFKANFRGANLDEGMVSVMSFQGGYGGMVVAGGGLSTVACCIRRDRLDECRALAPGQSAALVVEAMLRKQCLGVRTALRGSVEDGGWLSAGPLQPGIRVHGDDAIFRIGNAAGEAHPIIVEGMSMALQSAWLLCAQLLLGKRVNKLSDVAWQRQVGVRYAAHWRREFVPRMRVSASFAHFAMRPRLAAMLVAGARIWPGLLTTGAGWSGKARCAADSAVVSLLARTADR